MASMSDSDHTEPPMNTCHALNLLRGVEKFRDGRNFDFVLTCGAREWKVHKIMLSALSSVLDKSCFGGFKETAESSLDLSAYTEAEVDALVAYIYTGAYQARHDLSCPPLVFHVKMCIIGDYFSVEGLEQFASSQVA